MQSGTVVIINDAIGITIEQHTDHTVGVLCDDGKKRTFPTSECEEVVSPHAQALLTYNKLLKRV